MKILVTGASGFIGGNMVQYLAADHSLKIIASGRSATSQFDMYKQVEYFQWDLSTDTMEVVCDICIHCAGLADDRSTTEQLHRNNVDSTKNLLRSVRGCRIFVYISSSSVYDFSDGCMRSEKDADLKKNISHYGRSKLQAELLISESGLPSVYIFRPRAVYGNGDRVLLPRILQLIRNKKMIVPGSLQFTGSMTHIRNLCEAVGQSIIQHDQGLHIYNIADKNPYLMKSVFSKILFKTFNSRRFVHLPLRFVHFIISVNASLGRGSSFSRQALRYITQNEVLDISLIERKLSYTPHYIFDHYIDEMQLPVAMK